jgi:hypothetical protein
MKRLDIWDGMSVAGAGLASAGIGANWGFAWACMFLGGLLLSVAALHEWRAGRAKGE